MKLEQQVTSLEISKKLKELGVKQESLWFWNFHLFENGDDWMIDCELYYKRKNVKGLGEFYSAFTVAELGEMLPKFVGANRINISWTRTNGWAVCYEQNDKKHIPYIQTNQIEADARGKMLIYLLENNLLNPHA